MSDGMSDARYRAPAEQARFFRQRPDPDVMVTRIFTGEIPQIQFITNGGWGWRDDRPERMELHDYRMWIPGETRVVHDGCNPPNPPQIIDRAFTPPSK